MNPNIQSKAIPIGANGVATVAVTGSTILFTSSTGSFNFSIDGGPFQTGLCILGIDLSREPNVLGSVTKPAPVTPQFKSIILQDTSGAPNTVNFIVANTAVSYINPLPATISVSQKDAPTYIRANGVDGALSIPAASYSALFTGIDAGNLRKHFTIYNADPAQIIYIVGPLGTGGMAVPPLTSRILATSSSLKVHNPGAGAVSVAILELFYSP